MIYKTLVSFSQNVVHLMPRRIKLALSIAHKEGVNSVINDIFSRWWKQTNPHILKKEGRKREETERSQTSFC